MDSLPYILSIGWIGAKLLVGLTEVIGTTIYDLKQTKEQKELRLHPRSRKYKRRPMITTIVYAHDAEQTIIRCLESLAATRYDKLEIIVVDAGSGDDTSNLVRKFKKAHPKLKLKISRRKKPIQPEDVVLPAGWIHGEIVMKLNADCTVDKQAFTAAAQHFALNDMNVLVPAVRVYEHKSTVGLLQQFTSRRRVTVQTLGTQPMSESTMYALVRRKPIKNAQNSPYFADDVLIKTEPETTYSKLVKRTFKEQLSHMEVSGRDAGLSTYHQAVRILSGAVLALEPFMIAYFIYLAINFQRPDAIGIAWALGLLSLIFSIRADRQASFWQKLRLIALAPAMFSLITLLSLTKIAALLHLMGQKLHQDWQSWQPGYLDLNPEF